MPAFTQLCEKVNISLFGDTITVYSKLQSRKKIAEIKRVIKETQRGGFNEPISFVSRTNPQHDEYHQDDFSRDTVHIHMQFFYNIDESKLRKILAYFVKFELISLIEGQQFLQTFNAAQNTLAADLIDDEEVEYLTDPSKELLGLQQTLEALESEDIHKNNFIAELIGMVKKARELGAKAKIDENYLHASSHANLLCSILYTTYIEFNAQKKTRESCADFQTTCGLAIDLARIALQEQRQWEGVFAEVCANIGLAVGMLIVGYVAYGLYNQYYNNDRFMFFRLKTDSVEKLDKVQQTAVEFVSVSVSS